MIDYEVMANEAYVRYLSESSVVFTNLSNANNSLIDSLNKMAAHFQNNMEMQSKSNENLIAVLSKPKKKRVIRDKNGDIENIIEE